jgi:alpha-amylase
MLEITESLTSDVRDNPSDGDISVFPNPFTTSLTITNKEAGASMDIEVIEISGKLIKSLHSEVERVDLNTGELPKGIYLLKIRDHKSILTQKIVKE